MFKKKDRHDKSNYRPVSILPLLSKPFERILFEQINSHAKDILSKYQGGFPKRFSSQHSLLLMLEKWKKVLDNGGSCGALLVDLLKAFDCIVHDLLLAKLSAYGFDYNSLKLINSFLSGRKFRTKIGSSYSPYLDLLVGVPQGSILGLLLFNIYICNLFLCDCETNIINYADDTTLYACQPNKDLVLSKVEKGTSTVFTWFKNNYLKANSGKSHLLTTSDNIQHINVKGNQLSSSKSEELLGILKDHKLTFENQLLNVVQKVNQKLHALARISKYMPRKKLRTVMKAFVSLQFAYCPLIWMFHSRQINHKINKLHERALRIVSFEELLAKVNYVTVHQRNLQTLATEMYKILNGLSLDTMQDIFEIKSNYYNSRNAPAFSSRNIKTVRYGLQTISYMAPKIWDLVPKEMKEVTTLNEFKAKIKIRKLENCPCWLCRTYLPQIGFIRIHAF